MTSTITRQNRVTRNDDRIVCYFRDATVKLCYRYSDLPEGSPVWLYAANDTPIARYESVSELEAGVREHLNK